MRPTTRLAPLGAAALLAAFTGCSTMQAASHRSIMRGQVLESTAGSVYLCVGTADGATAGQQLSAYRFERGTTPSSKSGAPAYKREKTGTIQILEIVDEHYARGKVLSGDIKEGNLVELE